MNPYHDEKGQFCSATEMKKAISRLSQTNFFAASQLKEELDRYESFTSKTIDPIKVEKFSSLNGYTGQRNQALASAQVYQSLNPNELNLVLTNLQQQQSNLENTLRDQEETLAEYDKQASVLYGSPVQVSNLTTVRGLAKREAEQYGKLLANEIVKAATELGVPKKYAYNYVEKRLAELGAGSYYDNFSQANNIIGKDLAPATVAHFLKNTRPKEYGEKMEQAAQKVSNTDVFNNYNATVQEHQKVDQVLKQLPTEKIAELSRNTHDTQTLLEAQNKAIKIVQGAKQWSTVLKNNGFSKYSTVKEMRAFNPRDIKVDSTNKPVNVSSYNPETGVITPVTSYETFTPTVGETKVASFVDQDGGKHSSVTHYANYKTYNNSSVLIVDPTKKGTPLSEVDPTIVGFHYSYDSGD